MESARSAAAKILEDVLSFFGLNVVVDADEEGDIIHLAVPSSDMNGFLIGTRAETLRSLQNIVNAIMRSKGFGEVRVNVDIAGYKKQRAEKLASRAKGWMDKVKESGEPMHLEPMNAADRRTVHQAAGEAGISTESVGEGRERHIVLKL